MVNLTLEAILRSCKLIGTRTVICPHAFHRNKLEELKEQVETVFGGILNVFETDEDYKQHLMGDPLVAIAVNELGGEILC
jgi:hypothetical protein